VNRIITSVSLVCGKLEVTTYNVEAGSMIMFTPNNPRPGETPIVTRNINSKLNTILGFSISSLKQVVLLALIAVHGERIFDSDSYANIY